MEYEDSDIKEHEDVFLGDDIDIDDIIAEEDAGDEEDDPLLALDSLVEPKEDDFSHGFGEEE